MGKIAVGQEIVISETCDSLWGANECPNKAAKLLKHKSTPVYAIMCEPHFEMFVEDYGLNNIIINDYSLELNKQYAEEARQEQIKVAKQLEDKRK